MYVEATRRAYFFAGDGQRRADAAARGHAPVVPRVPTRVPDVGRQANFWIVEGIAMYMESLREEDGFYVLGGSDDVRIERRPLPALHDNFYVPLAEFCCLRHGAVPARPADRDALQPGGRTDAFPRPLRRRPLPRSAVAYLVAVYTGRATVNTLSQLTGVSYADLDKQYREFMESGLANSRRRAVRGRPPWRLEIRRGGGKITQRAATEGGR